MILAALLVIEPCAYGPLSVPFVAPAAVAITATLWLATLGTLFWHELRR